MFDVDRRLYTQVAGTLFCSSRRAKNSLRGQHRAITFISAPFRLAPGKGRKLMRTRASSRSSPFFPAPRPQGQQFEGSIVMLTQTRSFSVYLAHVCVMVHVSMPRSLHCPAFPLAGVQRQVSGVATAKTGLPVMVVRPCV